MITFEPTITGECSVEDVIKLVEFTALQIKWNQRILDELQDVDNKQ